MNQQENSIRLPAALVWCIESFVVVDAPCGVPNREGQKPLVLFVWQGVGFKILGNSVSKSREGKTSVLFAKASSNLRKEKIS